MLLPSPLPFGVAWRTLLPKDLNTYMLPLAACEGCVCASQSLKIHATCLAHLTPYALDLTHNLVL